MSPRENADGKARRYLTEGRVLMRFVGTTGLVADVRGDGAVHRVLWTPHDGWSCTCPARGRCAHLLGVGLITAPTPQPEAS